MIRLQGEATDPTSFAVVPTVFVAVAFVADVQFDHIHDLCADSIADRRSDSEVITAVS